MCTATESFPRFSISDCDVSQKQPLNEQQSKRVTFDLSRNQEIADDRDFTIINKSELWFGKPGLTLLKLCAELDGHKFEKSEREKSHKAYSYTQVMNKVFSICLNTQECRNETRDLLEERRQMAYWMRVSPERI